MSDRMEQLIQEHRLIPPGSTVLCAVSGGADSVYLLHRLYCLRRELLRAASEKLSGALAAHYDHRLRGAESTQDAKFVEEFVRLCCPAERLYTPEGSGKELPGVKLITGGGDVAGEAARLRQGLEETARQMRYAFLQTAAQEVGANLIATAHNASDNAETVLLHLGRGSGLRGLAGMPPKRGNLIRPLLTTSREEIENYLRYRGLPWREDATNRDDAYARNRLRHQVLPVLEDLVPGCCRCGSTGSPGFSPASARPAPTCGRTRTTSLPWPPRRWRAPGGRGRTSFSLPLSWLTSPRAWPSGAPGCSSAP